MNDNEIVALAVGDKISQAVALLQQAANMLADRKGEHMERARKSANDAAGMVEDALIAADLAADEAQKQEAKK